MNCKIIRLMYSFSGVAYGAYRDMMQSVLHQASLSIILKPRVPDPALFWCFAAVNHGGYEKLN